MTTNADLIAEARKLPVLQQDRLIMALADALEASEALVARNQAAIRWLLWSENRQMAIRLAEAQVIDHWPADLLAAVEELSEAAVCSCPDEDCREPFFATLTRYGLLKEAR